MQPKLDGECKSMIVLPALTHCFAAVEESSELGAFCTSAVKNEPSGNRVQPSSALKSLLPFELTEVHVRVFGLSCLICFVSLFPTTNLPLGRTTDGESPIYVQPVGGVSMVQVLAWES